MRARFRGVGRAAARVTGAACVLAGAWLLANTAFVRGRGFLWQELHAPPFSFRIAPADPESPLPAVRPDIARRPAGRAFKRGEAVAHLRLPRLGLDSVIIEGTDRASLSLGPGHLEGSGLPGDSDNCIIAGHRDGAFARLRSVRAGDTVELTASDGTHRYRVLLVRVVSKEDTSVLRPSSRPLLTLITCYPFEHVGPAPQRLVAVGELLPEDDPA